MPAWTRMPCVPLPAERCSVSAPYEVVVPHWKWYDVGRPWASTEPLSWASVFETLLAGRVVAEGGLAASAVAGVATASASPVASALNRPLTCGHNPPEGRRLRL